MPRPSPGQSSLFDLSPTRAEIAHPDLGIPSRAPAAALPRLGGARLAVLDALRRGPLTTLELVAVGGVRRAARVKELRDLGFAIDCEPVSEAQGVYRYTLVSEPN